MPYNMTVMRSSLDRPLTGTGTVCGVLAPCGSHWSMFVEETECKMWKLKCVFVVSVMKPDLLQGPQLVYSNQVQRLQEVSVEIHCGNTCLLATFVQYERHVGYAIAIPIRSR